MKKLLIILLMVGTAYAQEGTTFTFQGVVNVLDTPIPLSYTSTGRHVLGNPFTSGLKYTDNWEAVNLQGLPQVYFSMLYSMHILDTPRIGGIAPRDYIPIMTGFMVTVSDSSGSVVLPSQDRAFDSVADSSGWLLSGRNTDRMTILLTDSVTDLTQETIIVVRDDTSEGTDRIDTHFVPGHAPMIFQMVEGNQLVLNAVPEIFPGMVITVGIVPMGNENLWLTLYETIEGYTVAVRDTQTDTVHALPYQVTANDEFRYQLIIQ